MWFILSENMQTSRGNSKTKSFPEIIEIYHTYSKQLCWDISLQEEDPQVICKLKLKLSSFLLRHFLNEVAYPIQFSWWVLYFACWKNKTCHRAKQVFGSANCSKGLNQILFEGPSVDPTEEDEWMKAEILVLEKNSICYLLYIPALGRKTFIWDICELH